jgi:hypothetical protein
MLNTTKEHEVKSMIDHIIDIVESRHTEDAGEEESE